MNQAFADAGKASQSATGDAIPDSDNVSLARSAPRPFAPVRFSVQEYGEYTKQVYEGNDRAKAEAEWANVAQGVFLAANAEHAWMTIEKR